MLLDTTSPVLLLMLAAPTTSLAWHGYQLAKTFQRQQRPFWVFFYQDAVLTAHSQRWQPADLPNLTALWQQLANEQKIEFPVCVSAALQRGIVDADNAFRHQMSATTLTLANGFRLTGLGELSDSMHHAKHVLQF